MFVRFSTVAGERGAADTERDIRGFAMTFYTEEGNWDFWSSLPETFRQVTTTMSERDIPKSYRHVHGFGSHTFSMINAENERVWVKFHFVRQQGIENLTDAEAEAIIAKDRESHQRDLFEAIEQGDFPLIEVGYFELNRNPENHFADVEQATFNPANVVPGISFSPDEMLQGRLFAYGDAPGTFRRSLSMKL